MKWMKDRKESENKWKARGIFTGAHNHIRGQPQSADSNCIIFLSIHCSCQALLIPIRAGSSVLLTLLAKGAAFTVMASRLGKSLEEILSGYYECFALLAKGQQCGPAVHTGTWAKGQKCSLPMEGLIGNGGGEQGKKKRLPTMRQQWKIYSA